jgi:antitoxin ParD1/3/4
VAWLAKLRLRRCSAIVPDQEMFMRTLTLTIPDDLAEMIDDKVKHYGSSPSDVIRDGLLELQLRDAQQNTPAVERWLREKAVPTLVDVRAGREKLLTPEEVTEALEAHFRTL